MSYLLSKNYDEIDSAEKIEISEYDWSNTKRIIYIEQLDEDYDSRLIDDIYHSPSFLISFNRNEKTDIQKFIIEQFNKYYKNLKFEEYPLMPLEIRKPQTYTYPNLFGDFVEYLFNNRLKPVFICCSEEYLVSNYHLQMKGLNVVYLRRAN